jgi:L-ribulose-5-phosphate 4-epimerase
LHSKQPKAHYKGKATPPYLWHAQSMASTEGTIQFAYELAEPSSTDLLAPSLVASLSAWRTMLKRLQLLGQVPGRYDGFGYGNLSGRTSIQNTAKDTAPESIQESIQETIQQEGFVITASQTSGVNTFREEHLVTISGYNLSRFWVDAIGQQPPSSETLTHAMIYAADSRINWVFHVHCPEIWENSEALGIPSTGADVGYGSLDMVRAVADLLSNTQSRPLVFTTQGHHDGVFALGANARDTGGLLMVYLAKALELKSTTQEHTFNTTGNATSDSQE